MDLGFAGKNQEMGKAATGAMQAIAEMQEQMVDDEIAALDALGEDDFTKLREQRLADMKKKTADTSSYIKAGHGSYGELSETKEFFTCTKASTRVACCFYRPTSRYCAQMDSLMAKLAPMHLEARFVKMDAEKCPYLCEKLLSDPDGNVVIPTVLLVMGGKVVYHIRGMDVIGGDAATPAALGLMLALHGIIDVEAADDEYNNGGGGEEGNPMDMDEYRARAIREGGFGEIDSDDDIDDDGGTCDAKDA